MTSVYVFAAILGLLFLCGLVAAPLLEEEPADPEAPDGEASPEARKEAALDALEEIEFERETGKLSEEDYRRLRSKYARAAVEAREVASRTGDVRPEADAGPGACPECGAEVGADARFCARCGTELPR